MLRTKDNKKCRLEGHVTHKHNLLVVVLKIIARIVVSFECLKKYVRDLCLSPPSSDGLH